MYFKLITHLYSNLTETFKKPEEKTVWSGIVSLSQILKLMLFKKVDMSIVAYELASEIHLPEPQFGLAIHSITTHEQIESLNKVVGLANYKPDCINMLHKVFDNGGYGFIAFQNANPIGCCWASEKTPASLFPVKIPPKPGDICVHTLFVSQLNRGQKLGEVLASYRLWFLQKRHYKRAIAIVNKDNIAALKVNIKLGYATIGEVSGFRLLFWSRLRYKWY
jgi:hypothetical protein